MQFNNNNDFNSTPNTADVEKTKKPVDPTEIERSPHPVWEVIKFFLLATIIVVPIRLFIAQPFIVSGTSMEPTFSTSQYLIVDEISYRLHEPKRGDVIILKYPRNPSKFFIKRIIGLPGETLTIKDGVVLITKPGNAVPLTLDEPYLAEANKKLDDNMTVELTDTEYFVMGDNRKASLDSRTWGTLQERFIVGQAFLRLYPFTKAATYPGQGDFYSE
jgi:signal peptidase I